MVDADLIGEVREILSVDVAAFERRVAEEATVVREAVDDGVFDNPQGLVGLEAEFYAVANREGTERWVQPGEIGETGALARIPRRLLEYVGFEKELGLHNAELSTSPQPLNGDGLRAQEAEMAARLRTVREPMGARGLQLVSDGLWTVPPTGETAAEYLTDHATVDGLRFAANMSASPRYHAMSNADPRPSMELSVPHATLEAGTVLPESLITSIQPHYQVPRARDLPTYHRYALRIAGPLVALAANAPLLPPGLYDGDADPSAILADGHDEHRIAVFESVMNAPDVEKVRFPYDVRTVEGALDAVVADRALVPAMLDRDGDRFDDRFAHFRHKHGSYWRWIRPVFEGATRSAANARVEFRPLSAQPTIRDAVAFQAAVGGLLVGLRREDHPLADLDWARARENFYAAARDGLDADLAWITADGERTDETGALYEDLFAAAEEGLRTQGVPARDAERYLRPLRDRIADGRTPADWKRGRIRERLAEGASFEEAVAATQRAYVERQRETLFEGSFADWD
ncbi:MAG: hypothetical protein ABEI39_01940 [Halobacteriales archaeon]